MNIQWSLFLQAKSREKANRLLDHFSQAVGREVFVDECERYWKDQALFRATMTAQIDDQDMARVVLAALQLCAGVARSWVVGAPQQYADGSWEFSGSAVASTVTVPGIKEIDFRVGTLPITKRATEDRGATGCEPAVTHQQ